MTISSAVRNLTVSGRIGSGQTTLAKTLAEVLQWNFLEGGAIFQAFDEQRQKSELEVESRPDQIDLDYEEKIKQILSQEKHYVIQSHLAGFDAQGIKGVFKILVVCEDKEGLDKTEIRIDRLVNRKGITVEEAKHEVKMREEANLHKFRRLYAPRDPDWVYWDKSYYDFVVNTFTHNREESVALVLEALGVAKSA